MSSLEGLLPEMAGVFAAQESALANCVGVLTTQLQLLGADCGRHARRTAALETALQSLQSLQSLPVALEALEQQHERLARQQTTQLDHMRQQQAAAVDLSSDMEAQARAVVESVVAAELAALETKLTHETNARLLETANRAFLRAQQSEEAMQAQLEMLEKKFDFLSKIKMEIKDLSKRMDRQDQTLDDMRTGLALLAKSVGTDEIDDDDESDDHGDGGDLRKPSFTPDAPPLAEEWRVENDNDHAPLQEDDNAASLEAGEADANADADAAALPPPMTTTDEHEEAKAEEEEKQEATPPDTVDPSATEEENEPPPVDDKPAEHDATASTEPQPEDTPAAPEPAHEPVAHEPEVVTPESETPPPSEPPESAPAVEPTAETVEEERVPTAEAPPPVAAVVVPTAETESEDEDDFQTSAVVPVPSSRLEYRPSHPHMSSAPSTSTVAYMRSRRQERSAKRGPRRESALDASSSSLPARTPLSLEQIKVLWLRIFNKIVQLKRLQSINGASPERALFRRQHISMGARVKRLEESAGDLEDTVEFLETTIQSTGQTLQALGQAVAQDGAARDKKTKTLDEAQRMQAQTIVGIEEKLDNLEAEVRRLRNGARRDSTQNSVTTAAFTQIAAQIEDVASRLRDAAGTVDGHDKLLTQLTQRDVPALTASVHTAVLELRGDVDLKLRELAKDVARGLDRAQASQAAAERRLDGRLTECADALYRDLLVLTSAVLVAAELAATQTAALSSTASGSPSKRAKHKSALDVGVGLLQSVVSSFEADCRRSVAASHGDDSPDDDDDAHAVVAVLLDKLRQFSNDLAKLKEQADKAVTLGGGGGGGGGDAGATTKGFDDHLVLLCTNQLRALEEMLVAQPSHQQQPSLVLAHVKDLVIQLRAVLVLLVLHAQLVEPPRQLRALQTAQSTADATLTRHAFALSQLASVEAVVKLMHARLDAFLDMSFSFARDADVKAAIQETLHAGDALREQLVTQLDATHGDAVQRDERIERELAQLAGRVTKKLDKDEMLWTHEVLERRLQGVAKHALGEQDLVEIQHALRAKMDKTQFHALLQQQHAKLMAIGGGNGGGASNQPLVGTRCISCDGELPPSASQLRAAVTDEVQHEVAKQLAAAAKHHAVPSPALLSSPSPSSSSFNVSSHRSLDKHKKALLLAALQPPKK